MIEYIGYFIAFILVMSTSIVTWVLNARREQFDQNTEEGRTRDRSLQMVIMILWAEVPIAIGALLYFTTPLFDGIGL